jgi:hypothetical protein
MPSQARAGLQWRNPRRDCSGFKTQIKRIGTGSSQLLEPEMFEINIGIDRNGIEHVY